VALLFVYGSLRQGQSAHLLLEGCRRHPDGELSHAELIDHNGYPMLQAGSQTVKGEVYEVPPSRWPALDHWEEVPDVYARMARTLNDGRDVWVYERPNPRPATATPRER